MKKTIVTGLILIVSILLLTSCSGVSQSEYDKAISDLVAAQAQIQKLQSEKVASDIATAQARIQKLEAEVLALQDKLEQYTTRADNQSADDLTARAAKELANIQSAVVAAMTDQGMATLNTPQGTATSNMNNFPEINSNNSSANLVLYNYKGSINYVVNPTTKGTYTVNAAGTVTQVTTGY